MRRKFQGVLLTLLLVSAPASAAMLSLSAKEANLRSSPGGGVLWVAYRFTPFKVLSKRGGWVKVGDFEQDSGWISGSVLEKTPSLIVKTDSANLRKGPGGSYEVLWVLQKGYPLKKVKKQGEWYKVTDGAGTTGWLHESTVWGFTE